jgi:23S rRNA pseudouridine2605 synthase
VPPSLLFRLDVDSSGLLICTNDGALSQAVTHPSQSHEKEYLCLVRGTPSSSAIDWVRDGVKVVCEDGEYTTRPARLRVLAEAEVAGMGLAGEKGCSWVTVVVGEGKKRQVRRMMEAVGHHVYELKRIRIGPVTLDVPEGKWRPLRAAELAELLQKKKPSPKI